MKFLYITYGEAFIHTDDLKIVYSSEEKSQFIIKDQTNSEIKILFTQKWLLNLPLDKFLLFKIGKGVWTFTS